MEPGHKPSRRWLSDIALLHDALGETSTLKRCVRASVKASIGKRDRAQFVEDDVLRRLTESQNAAKISSELLALNIELVDMPTIVSFTVQTVPGTRQAIDCWFIFGHEIGETRVPVNVKTQTLIERKNRGCALGPFLNWLTEPDAKLDTITRNLDADQIILDLINRKKKLLPGRDYQLFMIDLTNGTVKFRSLFARHQPNGQGLAIARHMSRDVTNYMVCGDVIGADFDIARELGLALLPKPSQSRLETQHLANVLATKNHPE